MKPLLLSLIRFYQRYLNFNNSVIKGLFLADSACRFQPTCSEYMYKAINKHGILKGLYWGVKRIIRCHPWSTGGYDAVK